MNKQQVTKEQPKRKALITQICPEKRNPFKLGAASENIVLSKRFGETGFSYEKEIVK